jgi:hypothetical protein
MKRFYLFLLITILLVTSLVTYTTAQVDVSTGGAPTTYPTLKDAFYAINAGTHTGTISIDITGNITETATAMLLASGNGSANYSGITIRPSGNQARTISGNIGVHLINLSGADNVTIDGLNTEGNSLTMINTNTGSSATTLALTNDATNNTVQRCTILGSSGSSLSFGLGVIYFGSGTDTGTDNNTITCAESARPD